MNFRNLYFAFLCIGIVSAFLNKIGFIDYLREVIGLC